MLRYIGRLDAGDIVEALPRYDPADHLRAIASKGSMPWKPLVRLFDGAFLPHAAQRPIPAPLPAEEPSIAPAHTLNTGAETVDAIPVEPMPGTTSNIPPPHRPPK